MWKYNNVRNSDGTIIYDACRTVNELNLGESEMIEYAYQVADALGIQYCPVHGEYMIDEDGPVLIEVNCRPSGGHMEAEFLDRISGQHETDSIFDAYLKPERFFEEQKKRYRLFAHGVVKFFITPNDIYAESSPMRNIGIKLKIYYKSFLPNDFKISHLFIKTTDLNTSCGMVFLVNEDMFDLHKDVEFLRKVESRAFDLILSENRDDLVNIDENKCIEDSTEFLAMSEIYGTTLLVTTRG